MSISITDLSALRIRTTDALKESDFRAIKTHAKDWKLNVHDRIGNLRARITEEPHLRADLEEDRAKIVEYCSILQGIAAVADEAIATKEIRPIRVIRSDVMVQAIAAHYFDTIAQGVLVDADPDSNVMEVQASYVGTIATAPWNLVLKSPVEAEQIPLITKGAGTVLLLSLIRDAYFKGCAFLYLKPLEGSESFYSYLSMQTSHDNKYFFLDLKLKISTIFIRNVPAFELKEGEVPLIEVN